MADEVIITYGNASSNTDGLASGVFGEVLGTYVLDIGVQSSQLMGEIIEITAKDTGFWAKLGDNTASAAADTDGNFWIPANQSRYFEISTTQNYLDTAADA